MTDIQKGEEHLSSSELKEKPLISDEGNGVKKEEEIYWDRQKSAEQKHRVRSGDSRERSDSHHKRSTIHHVKQRDDDTIDYGLRNCHRSRSRSDSKRRKRSRSRNGHSRERQAELRRSESRKSESSRDPESLDAPGSKRKRRTGWDSGPSGASTSFSSSSPTSTGFTASLTGRTPDQIQAELAERQAQAAAVATSMQAKASLHQLCRIYVGSLDYSLTDADIRQVFSAFGPIVNIDMPKEGNRSKGFCFVEYTTPESAEMALQTMPGFNLKGRAIKVGRPTALGGQQPLATSAVPVVSAARPGGVNAAEAGQMAAAMLLGRGGGMGADAQNRVYVGNIPYTFTAEDIKQIFDVFGTILSCQLIPSNERPGTHRGYGFIEYATFEQAKLAIETMNDFPVAGKILKVNYATALRGPTGLPLANASMTPPDESSATGANAVPVPSMADMAAAGMQAINAMSAPAAPAAMTGPSPILLLSNMVDPEEANNDLKEEISQECSKYGNITQVELAVDNTHETVRIFVAFSSPLECAKAVPALHDRWFGGRKISAQPYDPDSFARGQYWK